MPPTHEVTNQAPERPDTNLYESDPLLPGLVAALGGTDDGRLSDLGGRAGSRQARRWAERANTLVPRLISHDRFGHRVDEVEYDDSYHRLMDVATDAGLHATCWSDPRPGAHVARAAGFIVWSQAEQGHMCPISMTYASVPALRTDSGLAARWLPQLTAAGYAPELSAPSTKPALLAGMAMTEKQGGSDVRTNTTRAEPQGDGTYRITGHKWFCSAPMSDLFLVLAQAPGGLTCFVLPGVLEDGTRNTIRIQRLKDKLGNRSNASSEIEYDGALAYQLGDEGRGVRTIVEMVSATRLDCVLGSAALMRIAHTEAAWHARHRMAFGRLLADQPLMQQVLSDIDLEVQAATALGMRLAQAVDGSEAGDEADRLLRRIALPAAKYYATKRAIVVTGEAMECLGGNGYAEDSGMPRLYREAPVNSVWEGSGNVNALDLLRAAHREPGSVDALIDELQTTRGLDAAYDDGIDALARALREAQADPAPAERQARWLAEQAARLLQASLLARYASSATSDAFVAARVRQRAATLGGAHWP